MFARSSTSFISTFTKHGLKRHIVNPTPATGFKNLLRSKQTSFVATTSNRHWMSDQTDVSTEKAQKETDAVKADREARK
jgi:hypothetical protein